MSMDNIIMLHYPNKAVLGRRLSKNAETTTLVDALHITKKTKKKNKEQNFSSYERKAILWMEQLLPLDNGFKYTAMKGNSSWNNKDATVYSNKDTITSIIEFYGMKNLTEYLKKII